jgi:threonine synthase
VRFYSLNNSSVQASFEEATVRGQAPDKGLYFPTSIPLLPEGFLRSIKDFTKEEIAITVLKPYVHGSIPDTELQKIISGAFNFEIPLIAINNQIFSLELFHGPTLAFKDVGARFMSRCLGYFVRNNNRKTTVLVATSGDTGGAVAAGFLDIEGIEVVILYPSGKVSKVQEAQLTTCGKNISAIEINGTFDDCQKLVKQAFADTGLNRQLLLTSANSINVARWLPQQVYYFFAIQQWPDKNKPPVISVPSGNFGNICAGLLAYQSGLPVNHFIAACNANNSIPSYLQSGSYQPKQAISTLSSAMDVGDPSNFVRILELFDRQLLPLKKVLSSLSISDEQTINTIKRVYADFDYLTDPHGAVGYLALEKYLEGHPGQAGIFLETAHPLKFYDVVEPIIGEAITVPSQVQALLEKPKHAFQMGAIYPEFKDYLLNFRP